MDYSVLCVRAVYDELVTKWGFGRIKLHTVGEACTAHFTCRGVHYLVLCRNDVLSVAKGTASKSAEFKETISYKSILRVPIGDPDAIDKTVAFAMQLMADAFICKPKSESV